MKKTGSVITICFMLLFSSSFLHAYDNSLRTNTVWNTWGLKAGSEATVKLVLKQGERIESISSISITNKNSFVEVTNPMNSNPHSIYLAVTIPPETPIGSYSEQISIKYVYRHVVSEERNVNIKTIKYISTHEEVVLDLKYEILLTVPFLLQRAFSGFLQILFIALTIMTMYAVVLHIFKDQDGSALKLFLVGLLLPVIMVIIVDDSFYQNVIGLAAIPFSGYLGSHTTYFTAYYISYFSLITVFLILV